MGGAVLPSRDSQHTIQRERQWWAQQVDLCGPGVILSNGPFPSTLFRLRHLCVTSSPGLTPLDSDVDTGVWDLVYAGNMIISDNKATQFLLVAILITGPGSCLAVSRSVVFASVSTGPCWGCDTGVVSLMGELWVWLSSSLWSRQWVLCDIFSSFPSENPMTKCSLERKGFDTYFQVIYYWGNLGQELKKEMK